MQSVPSSPGRRARTASIPALTPVVSMRNTRAAFGFAASVSKSVRGIARRGADGDPSQPRTAISISSRKIRVTTRNEATSSAFLFSNRNNVRSVRRRRRPPSPLRSGSRVVRTPRSPPGSTRRVATRGAPRPTVRRRFSLHGRPSTPSLTHSRRGCNSLTLFHFSLGDTWPTTERSSTSTS
jgi:hypothetical protein